MSEIDEAMKKKGARSTRNTMVTFEPRCVFRRKEIIPGVAVVDGETQREFPRLFVSSTLTTSVPPRDNPKAIREFRAFEPKLLHGK